MVNCISLFCAAFLSFAALILACVACAGSTKNYYPINNIFEAQLDLSNLDVTQVLPQLPSSFSSFDALGLPSYINVGLWSYCVADTAKKITSCTSPSGIQQFNLQQVIRDNISSNQVSQLISSLSQILLPEKLQQNMTYYNNLVKCSFITLLIGIAASGLNFVANLLRWILHFAFVTWVCRFLSVIAFLSLIISAGTSTGTYVYIRKALQSNYDTYGVKMSLGLNFYALIWASVAAALLNLIFLSAVKSRRYTYVRPIEEKPLV
ncbi:LAFA_0G11452g1_1 [Lachancea sp. 'fantastica']|nr:LAFA_0G11452g1_1 [Lachancea sp. 'fantastica']